jgi:capsular polysaccharide biosynthesis protein
VDFWDLTKLLARRWLISVPMLALSAVLTVLAVGNVQPNYVATAYVQLVAPVEGGTKPGEAGTAQRNPWLGQGLQTVGNAAIITVLDKTVVDEMEDAGLSDSYTVEMGATSPMVSFEVVGDSEQQARQTTERLVERFTQSVAKLQADDGVTAKDAINTRRLDLGTNIEESDSKVKRALVAVAGAGLLMTIAVTVGADALLRRRRRSKSGVPPPPPPTSAEVSRPEPVVPEPLVRPTSGVSAPEEDDKTVKVRRANPATLPRLNGEGATAERDKTARIYGAKVAEDPPPMGADAAPGTVGVDYQSPTGESKQTGSTDEDQPAGGSPLELTADATVVLRRSLPPKPDWPVRNGEKKKHP